MGARGGNWFSVFSFQLRASLLAVLCCKNRMVGWLAGCGVIEDEPEEWRGRGLPGDSVGGCAPSPPTPLRRWGRGDA